MAFLGLLALVVAILPLTAASAQDEEAAAYIDFDINEEIETSDALQTSILASQRAFPDGTDTVLLTTSEDGADALAAGVLANDGALLYYNSDDGVQDAHVDEITRLGATDVIIIGGEERIDADVETALTDMGLNVTRLAGDERISTANEVLEYAEANRDDFNETASHLSRAFGTDDNSQTAFADAVGLGAWDAQGGAGTVLAPSDAEVLSPEYPTTEYFTEVNPENETIVPIGGEAAVPADVVDYLTGEPAEQTAGDRVENEDANNRAGTAIAINEARGLDASDLDGIVVVDAFADNFFIDAYASSALAGNNNYAVVVSNGDSLSPETAEWLGSPAFAQNDGTTTVICMPKTSGEACEEAVSATGGDPEDIENVSLDSEETPAENAGVIISTGVDTYDYQPDDGSDVVTVTYANDDQNVFFVDGTQATYAVFAGQIGAGDRIEVEVDDAGTPDDDSDDITTHRLTNVDAAETGTIGNVNTAAGTFEIIEPVSGATISAGAIDYTAECDLFQVNGGVVIAAQFEAALNEGDVFETSEDAAGNVTCNIMDNTVSGAVSVVDTVTPDTDTFMVGNLGDDFAGTNDDTFVASKAKFDAGDLVINVDGEPITDYDDFADVLSDGDQAEYSRANDTETISLTNGLPTTVSGQAIDDIDASDGFDIATNPGTETAPDPQATDRFIVNGILGTEADFAAAYSAGDSVSYTPADAAGGTPATYTLSDQDLAGEVGATDTVAKTYEVLSSEGDVVLDTVIYDAFAPAERYFVDGEEVDVTEFETALDDIAAGDAEGDIVVTDGALAREHRLTVTEV
ncbi:Alkaline phosphatase [Euzebya pacifica]|uniref:Alkaline phosphatase n=1 Tax=Euzebya pacifica TaxID=1608957 RepID=A0A346XW05_9ACTN|nr:Alkaline phosphatase [Euzebya pacifica]